MTKPHALVVGMLATFALAVSACASLSVNSFTERGTDFSRYRTYKFGPAENVSTGDPRLDDNPFFNERVQAGVDKMLTGRGFEKTRAARADVLVHYHASVSQQIELGDSERNECVAGAAVGTPKTPPGNCQPYMYDAGTLLIDLVDGRTHKLLWRGWANGSMDGVMANQERMEQRVDESVTRILEKLPRRL